MFKFFKKDKKVADAAPKKIPQHIAFICDGNRRWAENRGLPPLEGHRAGIANFEKMADWFWKQGVTTITFFIFSTENWDRSKEEIDFLMELFCSVMEKNMEYALSRNVRYRVIGSRDRLPKKLAKLCDELEKKSAENTEGTVVFALNYGGQDEIVRAVNAAIDNGEHVSRETFETFMDTGDLLPVDLMVRTSNECRISNFLLWKLAYAELLFIPEHWPDLVRDEKIWQRVLDEYAKRDRRFGGGKKKDYSGKNKGK